MQFKEDSTSKEKRLQENLNKLEQDVSTLRLESDRLKNQVENKFTSLRVLKT